MGDLIRLNGSQGNVAAAQEPEWLQRHNKALKDPRGIERAIVSLRSGLFEYGIQYGEAFEGCELGNDAILGDDGWLAMARGYLALLNGPTGRLDCGTLDGEVRRWARSFKFEESEL